MDINEFIKQVKPRAKRSQLDPFKDQIFELRGLGYANWQIRDWLASNGIEVTPESVRKFILTRDNTKAQAALQERAAAFRQWNQGTSQALVLTPAAAGGDKDTDEPAAAAATAAGLSPKQRRERRADEFIKPENPLLNKIVKRKDP